MKTEINPQTTSRAEGFALWITSPMPMVTLTKTFDVSRIIKRSRQHGVKFNALLCWCIGKAATQIEEFYLLPEQGKLFKYDRIAINVIVKTARAESTRATSHSPRVYLNSQATTPPQHRAHTRSAQVHSWMIL